MYSYCPNYISFLIFTISRALSHPSSLRSYNPHYMTYKSPFPPSSALNQCTITKKLQVRLIEVLIGLSTPQVLPVYQTYTSHPVHFLRDWLHETHQFIVYLTFSLMVIPVISTSFPCSYISYKQPFLDNKKSLVQKTLGS